MSTTVLQAHRRVDLSRDKLGSSTPPIDADDSDASTSPHFNTLRNTKPERAQKLIEYPVIDNMMRTVPTSSTDCTSEPNVVDSGQIISYDHVPRNNLPQGKPCIEDDDDDSKSNEPSHQPSPIHEADTLDQSYFDPPVFHEGTPDSNTSLNSRMPPSSSIPHLLSTSFSSQKQNRMELPGGGLGGIQHQFSFLGLDAALPSPGCEREGAFSFSTDDGDQGFFKNSVSPGNGVTVVYQHQGVNFGTPSMLQESQHPGHSYNRSPGGNVMHNNSSLNGELIPPSQNMPSYMTPPHALVEPTAISPPYKVAALNAQNMQLSLQRRLSESRIDSSNTATSENKADSEYLGNNTGGITDSVNPMHIPNRPTSPLESNTTVSTTTFQQQQRQPYQSKCRQQKSAVVRPVLYSAINSLERYNAGSFDNKVIMAKAYGKMGNRRAFPGIPSRDRGDGRIGPNSFDSDMGSKASSVSSNLSTDFDGRRKESIGSIGDGSQSQSTMSGTRELSGLRIMPSQSSDRGSESAQRTENEQIVPILQKKSGKMPRAKSSGQLSKSSERGSDQISQSKASAKSSKSRGVTIVDKHSSKKWKPREKTVGVFRPSCDAYTPRMGNRAIKYKAAEERPSVEKMSSTMGTIQRPNFRDALRRVAIILHQHIVKIERRFETGIRGIDDTGLFKSSMREYFSEDNFATPRYKCSIVRVPMARPGVVYSMRKIRVVYNTPTTDEIYEFAHQLFKKVQLSSECSIVCLIYVEKLMEVAKVPLVSNTWKPIFMCGLLLASKVWQDLSSWNIEFASVYPQFSLDAINRLELQFLKSIKWDLYISSSLYAKYYFALRSLLEKSGFRDRYNQMVGGIGGIAASEAIKISKRSEAVKEEALLQLSRSM
mmetsp:Transcript_25259/g.52118  ORF Transcript_25259/g.52118 Transcript_25259/m.52118 type:complete len:880 (+) Transcript_25259:86-2725(+)